VALVFVANVLVQQGEGGGFVGQGHESSLTTKRAQGTNKDQAKKSRAAAGRSHLCPGRRLGAMDARCRMASSSSDLTPAPAAASRPDSRLPSRSLGERWSEAFFGGLYRRNLVYNICWEDPALDHAAMELRPAERPAGAETRGHSGTGVRRFLRPVRGGRAPALPAPLPGAVARSAGGVCARVLG
jgi:hypothetical protein